jgi:hypothetical protein
MITIAHRPGPRQRAILAAMRAGAHLYLESGIWYHDGVDRVTVSGPSCRSLWLHGRIRLDEVQLHPFWRGGVRWRYVLTEQGKAADATVL